MITRRFIEKIHYVFDELNYHETKQLNYDCFEKAVINTLTHCKDLEDAIEVVRMYQFCSKKWRKIEKIYLKKLGIFNQYDFEGNSLISVVPDDEALGTYYITNGLNKKVKEIFIASHTFDDELFALDYSRDKFRIFEDGKYYIKHAILSSDKMKLFDNDKNCLCNIVLSKDCDIFLENNYTPYEIVLYDGLIGIYDRRYIDGLSDDSDIDPEKMVATIEWDILESSSEFGVAKLEVYEENQDLEMLLLFATSTFLVFQKYMAAQVAHRAWRSSANNAAAAAWITRR